MNTLYKLSFGLELDKNGNKIELTQAMQDEYDQLLNDVIDHFGGYTTYPTSGGYKHDSGNMVKEDSAVFEILAKDSDRDLIVAIAEDLKEIFNQESVLLTETKINAVFI